MKMNLIISTFVTLTAAISAQAQQLAKIPSNFDQTPWVVATENLPLSNTPRTFGGISEPMFVRKFSLR